MAFVFQRARIIGGRIILWFLDPLPRCEINAVGKWERPKDHPLRGVTNADGSRPQLGATRD